LILGGERFSAALSDLFMAALAAELVAFAAVHYSDHRHRMGSFRRKK